MEMSNITINGRQYEFADITLIAGGRDVVGFQGIEYTEKQDKEVIYGKGNKPVSIQKGNKGYEGSLDLLQSEVNTLQELARAATGSTSLMGLNINAVVCYGNPTQGDVMTVDRLFNMQFTELKKGMKQGDKNMKISLPFICTDIKYNS